ncbi:MAG TPA: hypothetical protein VMT64_17520 [Candidatus Binataceae bacterium]|nr:hypothetical protein [Candidatus Binataceae bacterium]
MADIPAAMVDSKSVRESKMKSTKTIVSTLTALTFGAFIFGGVAHADEWQNHHPRRAEVNHRLGKQNHRIDAGLKKGQLTAGEAAQLHTEDQQIRAQEQADAAAHNGHITKAEKHQLNQEEKAESKQIHEERHDNQ